MRSHLLISLTAASWANMKPEAIVTMLASLPYIAFSVSRPNTGVVAVLLQHSMHKDNRFGLKQYAQEL